MITEFEPSAQLLILGKLRLILCSPAQLESAIRRNDPETAAVRNGTPVYEDGTELADKIKHALGLGA